MDKLESEIRKEINEMNLNLSLMDNLEETNDEEPITPTTVPKQPEFLSPTALEDTHNSNNNKHSLTDSQISMISKHDDGDIGLDNDHFYNTPATPPPLMTSTPERKQEGLADDKICNNLTVDMSSISNNNNNISNSNLNDVKRIVKDDTPTSPVPIINGTPSSIVQLIKTKSEKPTKKKLPTTIYLGTIQLLLCLVLAALGGLVIARNASLSMSGTGLWAGAICGIAGSLGLMNVKAAHTGFLAVSLICVASSTLGLALTGIGVIRDYNLSQADATIWGAVTAGTGLLFTLAVHFLVSVFSVYYSALRLCSRPPQKQMMQNVISSNPAFMTQQKVEDYINSLQVEPSVKDMMYQSMMKQQRNMNEKCGTANSKEKLYSPYVGQFTPPSPNSSRQQVMLIPATQNLPFMSMYPPPMMYPPNLLPPGVQYMYNGTMIPQTAMNESMATAARPSRKRSNSRRVYEQREAEDRLRRKSDSDAEMSRQRAFTYTGMDRDIADDFLQHQEDRFNSSLTDGTDCPDCIDCLECANEAHRHNYRNSFGRYNDVQM